MSSTCTECSDAGVTLYRKRNKTIRVTLTGPSDITGAKIWFSVKQEGEDADADALITKKSLNNGGTDQQAMVIDGPGGILEVYILPADTENMEAGSYVYDIVIELAGADPRRLEAVPPSLFQILQPVTLT